MAGEETGDDELTFQREFSEASQQVGDYRVSNDQVEELAAQYAQARFSKIGLDQRSTVYFKDDEQIIEAYKDSFRSFIYAHYAVS